MPPRKRPSTPLEADDAEELDDNYDAFAEAQYSDEEEQESYQDETKTELKEDHESRPCWITPDCRIILEAWSPLRNVAQDFLVAIAEPSSRPIHMHEYILTQYSLYAAVSVGFKTDEIIRALDHLSKLKYLPPTVITFIQSCTASYGKVKMVLKRGHYFIETSQSESKVMSLLMNDSVIIDAMVKTAIKEPAKLNEGIIDDSLDTESISFEIIPEKVDIVRHRCAQLNYPVLEEYDFRADQTSPPLPADLRSTTSIRPYQEQALSKMFGNGRARSGIIVLPCGAGKSLVGIIAATTIKKACLVLCTSAVAVEQWKAQFRLFSTIPGNSIGRFTSDCKEFFNTDGGNGGILITTYTMLAYSGRRSHTAKKMLEAAQNTEWGLMVLDEVHVVPAQVFSKVLTAVSAHAKLGLTATLVREDSKIASLNWLIGPKLYEANWLDLAQAGHIARVQCAEVWCPMPASFAEAYLSEKASRKRRLLYVMNPGKIQACNYLIRYHEARGDKIIVFSDNVFALEAYARKLGKPYIYGPTSQSERMHILQLFKESPTMNTIFLSKVGDTSIDLPEATCLIQISSHYGSRRQEAQRLGRILRAKRRDDSAFNAYFYSLVSRDTEEMYYSAKRQQFLVDQGYQFKVITELHGMKEDLPSLAYSSAHEQEELLRTVLLSKEENEDEEAEEMLQAKQRRQLDLLTGDQGGLYKMASATGTSLRAMSGSTGMAYMEYNKPITAAKLQQQQQQQRHKLFKGRDKK